MDHSILKDKLTLRIRPLTTNIAQAMDIVDAYLALGPAHFGKVAKELMCEHQWLTSSNKTENEKTLDEISAASAELNKVVGE